MLHVLRPIHYLRISLRRTSPVQSVCVLLPTCERCLNRLLARRTSELYRTEIPSGRVNYLKFPERNSGNLPRTFYGCRRMPHARQFLVPRSRVIDYDKTADVIATIGKKKNTKCKKKMASYTFRTVGGGSLLQSGSREGSAQIGI